MRALLIYIQIKARCIHGGSLSNNTCSTCWFTLTKNNLYKIRLLRLQWNVQVYKSVSKN